MKLSFFTNPSLLSPQSASGAFGPVEGSAATQYRVCSRHSAISTAAAHAVCDGVLLAQRMDDQHINLILKPLRHQFGHLPPIAYFVYRGVLRSSLISGQQIAAETTSDLAAAIWQAHAALVQSVTEATGTAPTTNPGPELLGLGPGDALDGDTPAAQLFADVPQEAVLPLVRQGWTIGTFDQAGFAFQVVLESIGNRVTLDELRSPDQIIEVAGLDAAASDANTVAHWHTKQRVGEFVDPTAFFSAMSTSNIHVPSGSGGSGSGGSELDSQQFSSTVLDRFHNRELVYLDVREQHDASVAMAGDFGSQIKITAGGATNTVDVRRSGWPILQLTAADFVAIAATDTSTSFEVAFPVGENAIPVLFINHGSTPESFPQSVAGHLQFSALSVVDDFTSPLELQVPAAGGSLRSSYVRLTYVRGFDWAATFPRQAHDRVMFDNHVVDNLFLPFAMVEDVSTTGVKVFHRPRYVDDPHTHDCDMAMSIGAAVDAQHVTFFAFPSLRNIKGDDQPSGPPLTDRAASPESFLRDMINRGDRFTFSKRNVSAADGATQTLLEVGMTEDVPRFLATDWRDFYAVTFTHAEFTHLKASLDASALDQRFPVYLGVANHTADLDQNGKYFEGFQLVLRGFAVENGQLVITSVDTGKTLFVS